MAIQVTTKEVKLGFGNNTKCVCFDIVKQDSVSTDDIIAAIEKETGIPAIEVMTVVRTFYWKVSGALLEGKAVDIVNFGALQPVITGTPKKGPEFKVNFRSKGDFKKCLSKVEFEEVKQQS